LIGRVGPDAGLPPETTFVWDPISDQLVSVFDTATGKPIRQFSTAAWASTIRSKVAVAEANGAARTRSVITCSTATTVAAGRSP
jgi:hypothetical protein